MIEMKNKKLPNVIPVFPLSKVVMFPHTILPLNIFEKRYLQMVNDSIAGNRFIGMVQPRRNKKIKELDKNPLDIYSVGCLGKITSFSEIKDGRIIIALSGISRFKIEKEIINKKLYREFSVYYEEFENDLKVSKKINEKINIQDLYYKVKVFFSKKGLLFNWKELEKLELNELIDTISMIAPFTMEEKQSLLEANDLKIKLNVLDDILSIYYFDKFENKTIQ